ncbi:hypothetical protein [Methylobacterium oxalidis]|nr:hypothetical protein [Methylobacterium oxalidis]GJE32986.1 hypothetical protein LDDCCGHA_3185 [Methylobacterium oxalidis]
MLPGSAAADKLRSSLTMKHRLPASETTGKRRMYTARAKRTSEQWLEPPEPALDRYLLRTRPRAANDNRRLSVETFRTVQIGAGLALVGALSLVVALIH